MNSKAQTDTHAQAFELLPWFVNGTLGALEHNMVRAHVQCCEVCADEMQWLRDTLEGERAGAQVTPLVASAFERVRERIESQNAADNESLAMPTLVRWWRGSIRWLATALQVKPVLAAVPALFVLCVIGGYHLYDMRGGNQIEAGSYSTLSGESSAVTVHVVPSANAEQLTGFFARISPQATVNARDDGSYLLHFDASVDLAEISQLLSALESSPQIASARLGTP